MRRPAREQSGRQAALYLRAPETAGRRTDAEGAARIELPMVGRPKLHPARPEPAAARIAEDDSDSTRACPDRT